MKREDFIQLALAGTVTFPNVFPNLAELSLQPISDPTQALGKSSDAKFLLVAIERPSARVTITRKIPVTDVRALLIPQDPAHISVQEGTWFVGNEAENGLRLLLNGNSRVLGIVYVAENTPTLLEVNAGMTAAESSQYYPPLPCDRSNNHYDPDPGTRALGSAAVYTDSPFGSCDSAAPRMLFRRTSCELTDPFVEQSFVEPPTFSCDLERPAAFKGKTGSQ